MADRTDAFLRRDVLATLAGNGLYLWARQCEATPARVTERFSVGDVPVLVSRPTNLQPGARLVLLYHGFGQPGSPEALEAALPLRDDRLIGVYVNLPLLAGRLPEGGSAELERLQAHDFVNGLYFRSIEGAVREMPAVAGRVAERYSADLDAGLHLFGFSAGGSAVMLALIESELRIASAAVVNAPMSVRQNVQTWEKALKRGFTWDQAAEDAARRFDVAAHASQIAKRRPPPAILMMQSDADPLLPLSSTFAAYAALEKAYRTEAARQEVRMRVMPGRGHNFSESSPVADEIDAWLRNR